MTAIRDELLARAECYGMCYDPQAVPRWSTGTVHAFEALLDDVPQIQFEGTCNLLEWAVDLAAIQPWPHEHLGDLAEAFWQNTMQVAPAILDYVKTLTGPYDIQGHSKGGPNGLCLGAYLTLAGYPPRTIVAFECARAGGRTLRNFLLNAGIRVVQTVTVNMYGRDIVTTLPPWGVDITEPIVLTVPDSYDIAQKHRLPGVIDGIRGLPE